MAYQSEIEKLEQRYHENPQQWFAALADSYRKAGDLELALEVVRGGLEKRPNYASGHIVLGRCLVDQDKYSEAAGAFEHVLELDAENIIALKSLGEIAEKQGDFDGAKSWLTKLLDIDPMNEEARVSIERVAEAEQAAPSETQQAEEADAAPSIEPGAAWAAEALASMDRGEQSVDRDGVETAEGGGGTAEEMAPVEPAVLEQPPVERESMAGADQVLSVEKSSWDDANGAAALAQSESGVPGLELEVENDATEEAAVEPVIGFEATAAEQQLQEQEDKEPGAPGEVGPKEESEQPEGGPVRVAGDLEVVSFDEELSWDAGDRPSTAATDGDVQIVEAHHQDLVAPVEFLGDPQAYAAREEREPAHSAEQEGPASAAEWMQMGGGKEPSGAGRDRLDGPADASGDSADAGQSAVDRLEPSVADAEGGYADEPTESVGAESEETSLGWEPPSAQEQVAFERASEADEPADLPLIMPDEVGAGPEPAAPGADEMEPVVTETMAEVYARQGLYAQARETYERLLQQRPGDPVLEQKLALLSQRLGAQRAATSSRFSVAATGGISAVDYLRGLFKSGAAPDGGSAGLGPRETTAPEPAESSVLESAFGSQPDPSEEPPGSPTIPASDEVSLSSVFGGEPPAGRPAPRGRGDRPPEQAGAVSFDQFYGTVSDSESESDAAAEPEPAGEEGDDDFKNWLEGLKT